MTRRNGDFIKHFTRHSQEAVGFYNSFGWIFSLDRKRQEKRGIYQFCFVLSQNEVAQHLSVIALSVINRKSSKNQILRRVAISTNFCKMLVLGTAATAIAAISRRLSVDKLGLVARFSLWSSAKYAGTYLERKKRGIHRREIFFPPRALLAYSQYGGLY